MLSLTDFRPAGRAARWAKRTTRLAAAACLATTAVLVGTTATATAATTYPVAPNIVVGGIEAGPNPAAPPPGADLASCHSSAHPYPVILVDGTFANQRDDFGALAPELANAGYCVYTYAYGAPPSQYVQSVGPVPASARQLATEVSGVKAATGASQVDLVGHSQGGMLAEYYAKLLGGAPNVHDIVGLSPSTHGTTAGGLFTLASYFPGSNAFIAAAGCQACVDQESTSPVIQNLDSGPIAQSGVTYTIIETQNETVVTPVGSSFIEEPGVTNEYVQQFCPSDGVDHVDLPYDLVVTRLVENALEPATAASPNCSTEFPYPA
jgi:triacylglycerol esterase/lipase EstA (alpha/beta hydrolase family)